MCSDFLTVKWPTLTCHTLAEAFVTTARNLGSSAVFFFLDFFFSSRCLFDFLDGFVLRLLCLAFQDLRFLLVGLLSLLHHLFALCLLFSGNFLSNLFLGC